MYIIYKKFEDKILFIVLYLIKMYVSFVEGKFFKVVCNVFMKKIKCIFLLE